jgi:hypothetical protein
MLGLCALLTIIGTFTLAGCYLSHTIEQATASDVNNQSFTFANGAVFHSALENVSATLSFSDNATSFTLASSGGTATGTNRFDSCVLTVVTSTFGTGPQVGEVITLDPCEFDSDRKTLTVENRSLTATSMVATVFTPGSTGNVNQATASNVNNQSFTFTSGEVFHRNLINISTVLSFTDNATNFSLTSAGAGGTATGTNRFSSCILTVESSTYAVGTGPQANTVITLNPCNFDNTAKTLTVTNAGITATSAPAMVIVP